MQLRHNKHLGNFNDGGFRDFLQNPCADTLTLARFFFPRYSVGNTLFKRLHGGKFSQAFHKFFRKFGYFPGFTLAHGARFSHPIKSFGDFFVGYGYVFSLLLCAFSN